MTIDLNPFNQFDRWYKEHLATEIAIPDSVSLGTASDDGHISIRTVLLKGYDERGFVFFTNYNSRKGLQLSLNAKVALLFYWPESGRQIRIEGIAHKVTSEESELYFKSRPRESQLSTWASQQSTVIRNRKELEDLHNYYNNLFLNKAVPRPDYWGGYRIVPAWFEFWQDREFRLHDRLTYRFDNNNWIIERLAP